MPEKESWLWRRLEGAQDALVSLLVGAAVSAGIGILVAVGVVIWGTMTGLAPAWVNRATGALAAFGFVIVVCLASLWIRSRRRRALERMREAATAPMEKGFLDFLVDKARAERQLGPILARVNRENEWIGKRIASVSVQLGALSQRGPANPTIGQRIAMSAASDMRKTARRLEDHAAVLDRTVDLLTEGTVGYVRWFTPSSDIDRERLRVFRAELEGLAQGAAQAAASQRGYQGSVESTRGISQEMNAAVTQLSAAIGAVVRAIEKVVARSREACSIIDYKTAE